MASITEQDRGKAASERPPGEDGPVRQVPAAPAPEASGLNEPSEAGPESKSEEAAD